MSAMRPIMSAAWPGRRLRSKRQISAVPPFSWLTQLFPNVKPYPPGQGDADGLSRNIDDCNKGCIGITTFGDASGEGPRTSEAARSQAAAAASRRRGQKRTRMPADGSQLTVLLKPLARPPKTDVRITPA